MDDFRWLMVALILSIGVTVSAHAQTSRYEELAELPFEGGYPTREGVATLKDELLFQRAVQSYIWALPALNMYGMSFLRIARAPMASSFSGAVSSRIPCNWPPR